MMEILEIVLGLAFTFLLMSLLATVVQEMAATLLSLRGRVLLDGVVHMLEKHGDIKEVQRWKEYIKETKVYSKYREQGRGVKRLPSYLTSDQVIAVLQEVMEADDLSEGEAKARGFLLPGEHKPKESLEVPKMHELGLRDNLLVLKAGQKRKEEEVRKRGFLLAPLEDSEESEEGQERGLSEVGPRIQEEMEKAKQAISQNFNGMMDRASGWYKRRVQFMLLIWGFLIAVAFDADTFEIYRNLSRNPESRQQVIALAQNYLNNNAAQVPRGVNPGTAASPQRIAELRAKVEELINEEIEAPYSALGLGWQTFPERPPNHAELNGWQMTGFYVVKFFGWVITMLAISLGASFWFDLLKLLMNIRNAGNPPQETTQQQGGGGGTS